MFMNYNFNCDLLEQEAEGRSFPWARPCDGCHAAPRAVYCHADAAYLCVSCDTQVHSANRMASRHERVLVCVTCESAPAVLACHADSAALCATCDAQVHSTNPIAQRHQRVPVLPLPAVAVQAASGFAEVEAATTVHGDMEEGEKVDSWLQLRRDCDYNNCTNNIDKNFNLFGYDMYYDDFTCNPGQEEQFRLEEQQHVHKEGCEFAVPSQVVMGSEKQELTYGMIGAEKAAPMTVGTSIYTASIGNSISFSSMAVGVVPEDTRPDVSNTNILRTSGAMELTGHSLQMPVHFSSMDREARVLRYKEKKQVRQFQKTIRYATRKTYAEARTRIKGRFAKKSDIEHEVDHMLTTPALPLPDSSHGTVLWF